MATNNEYQVEEHDVEYQRLAGKPWLARMYRPKGIGPFPAMLGNSTVRPQSAPLAIPAAAIRWC